MWKSFKRGIHKKIIGFKRLCQEKFVSLHPTFMICTPTNKNASTKKNNESYK